MYVLKDEIFRLICKNRHTTFKELIYLQVSSVHKQSGVHSQEDANLSLSSQNSISRTCLKILCHKNLCSKIIYNLYNYIFLQMIMYIVL